MQIRDGAILLSPSDLSNYLACPHLTTLEREVELGGRQRPHLREALAELVAEKGDLHEQRYLDRLHSSGRTITEIALGDGSDGFEQAAVETAIAMRGGTEVIYQATFVRDGWRGRSDFVIRIEEPSELGPWSYEPWDTKLARSAKPAAVLQLAWYAGEIAQVQGHVPERVHLVLGTGETESHPPGGVEAYLRRAQARLRSHLEQPPETYPWPCAHCSRCDFAAVCRERLLADDHLTRVATIRRDQIGKLGAVEISTLTALAESEPDLWVPRLAAPMVEKLHDQAGLQLQRERSGELAYRLLAPEEKRGLGLLPEPSRGDLFFDMEGDPFFDPALGLEFLFGVLWRGEDGTPTYQGFWAHDHETERVAFEQFVDLVVERRKAFPAMHVYHYATYEPATLGRLMSTHATREEEIDELLRDEVLVDLFQVVRQSIRAGVASYSLKDVEQLFFSRSAEVSSGNEAMIEFERWLDDRDSHRLEAIAAYNEEDCLATLELRDWLLERRPDAEREYGIEIPFLPPPEERASPEDDALPETARLRETLLASAGEADGRELCARLLEYHRREARPPWWWWFQWPKMTDDDLTESGEALGSLRHDGEEPRDLSLDNPRSRSLEWTFAFPPQQHGFSEGGKAHDPRDGGTSWTITALDNATGEISLSRSRSMRDLPLPTALVPGGPIRTKEQEAALRRFATSLLDEDGRYPHLERLLRRELPLAGEILQCDELDQQRALLDRLADSYLVVQGPPGSGKTYRGARLVTHLLAQGRKVGITAQSHKVIDNLLGEIERAAAEEDLEFRGIRRGAPWESAHVAADDSIDAILDPEVTLVAGTAWTFARERLDRQFDTLVIDEAGQYSLADALATGTCAGRLVLLGDPLQLAQVTQGVHPAGSGVSVLEHALGEHDTIPEDRGVFLTETRRMHPDVCRFISEAFYEGRLASTEACSLRTTSDGTGIRWLAIPHEGNSVESDQEAEAIATEIERLVGHRFRDGDTKRELRPADVMVLAPYNAQVRLLRERLPDGVEVGTVDRFQGREAAIAFYSMASSSGEDVPRGLDFLLSRNRLNVAVSRAQCLAYVVCSPRLLEVDCRTVDQLRLANTLCLYAELARNEDVR